MKKYIIIVCVLLSKAIIAQEPDKTRLSVQDCIEMALENNIELKNSHLEIYKARATKNEARAEYFPTISAQAVAFDALNPMLTFGIEDIDNAQLRQLLYTLYAEYGANMGLDKDYSFAQNGVMLNAMATELKGDEQEITLDYMREIKAVTAEDLAGYADVYSALIENGAISTTGSASVLKANADLYDVILAPFASAAESEDEDLITESVTE